MAGLLAAITGMFVGKDNKQYFAYIGTAGCIVIISGLAAFIQPIIQFVTELTALGNLQADVLRILLKSVGIAIITELTCGICTEIGFGSIGKMLQFLGSTVILWLSIPVFQSVLDIIQNILGEV